MGSDEERQYSVNTGLDRKLETHVLIPVFLYDGLNTTDYGLVLMNDILKKNKVLKDRGEVFYFTGITGIAVENGGIDNNAIVGKNIGTVVTAVQFAAVDDYQVTRLDGIPGRITFNDTFPMSNIEKFVMLMPMDGKNHPQMMV